MGWKFVTMIAALSFGSGNSINTIILTGDSRVTFYTESGKLESFNDKGQKVFSLTENVFIGFAGDFYNVSNIVAKFKKKLLKPKLTKPVIFSRAEFIVKEITNVLKREWSKSYSDSSVFIVIRDLTDKRVKLYQADSPDFEFTLLGKGLHLIGGDDVDRIRFRESYRLHYDYINPTSVDHHAIPIWSSFQEIASIDINGLNPCYLIQSGRWTTLHHAFSDDGGENWIANAATGDGNWERQANGKQTDTTELDHNKVMDDRHNNKRR